MISADVAGARVLVVLYYYSPYVSGLTLATRAIVEGLAGRGAHVTVLCGSHDGETPTHETIGGVSVHRLRPVARIDKGMVLPTLVPRAAWMARDTDVVIPVLPLLEAGALARLVPRRKFLPFYVCDLRLSDRPVSRLIENVAARGARASVRRAPSFLALSREYAAASRVVGSYASRVVGVAPPVDPSGFYAVDPGPLRARLGIASGPVVGFVGRLVAEKGLPVLLDACRELRTRIPGLQLVIAGEGRAVAGGGIGADLARDTHDSPWVHLTGHLPDEDLTAFYSLCDVLALPSIDPLEAYGIVQVEAMLCGTPVVASDMPGVRIPVTLSGMGVLAVPGDANDLAEALADVLQDVAAVRRPRSEIMELFDPGLSIDAIAEEITRRRLP